MRQIAIHDRLLREFIEDALLQQKDRRIAMALALKLDAGDYRIIGTFSLDRYDLLDPASLTYCVEIRMLDGWAELCSVHWTRLGLEWTDVMAEVESVCRQHEEGSYPDGPLDPDWHPV